ncbi:VWA domain-containing protein [Chryseobacterium sp. SNU WT5]|uniref:VWA domain-containing protein n=1 Tax=Chryseobacterium sp. SNU WT5 TaxID=2594269 RepID=UPI0011809AEE|nr:VWA domain-containing protein [Chryseobacterium sp. SNU WT5]QDP84775.1 VWA domain-containing protein [Chryseobacterium sp. SNU WT5]
MKNTISTISLLGAGFILTACAVRVPSVKTPKPEYYGNIEQTMVINGFPRNAAPWVVYSDREKNNVFLKKEKNESPKEIKFLEPLLVLDHNKSRKLVKVAEYNPDALLKKIPAKSVKSYGWISEDNLLLWSNALSERTSGFTMKAAVAPSNVDVLRNAGAYLKNDSAIVYSSPNFSEPIKKKIAVGQLVYVYKKSADEKGYLIGQKPKIDLDSIGDNIYGWVSSNMISSWGERSAIKLDSNFDYSTTPRTGIFNTVPQSTKDNPTIPLSEAVNRSVIENIYPTSVALNKNSTRYFMNAFDYSQNYIFNVIGEKLPFNRYKQISRRAKKLNIVFALDVSADNRAYTPIAKSIIQDIQLKISKLSYYRSVKYSVVLFKNNPCGTNVIASMLSSDASGIFNYIDEKTAEMKCERGGGQPVNDALATAGDLLNTVPDETNLIVLIGSTAASNSAASSTVRLLSSAKAKLISYQTESGASDVYNNFVLLSENIVTSTSQNISELNKEKVADQSFIRNKNNFNLVEGDEGVYSLDYPAKSMTQGFVIYPKRREANNNSFLMKALDTLLMQVTDENIFTNKSLTSYFKSEIGSNKTILDGRYSFKFQNAPNPIPVPVSSELITYDFPMVASGYIPAELRKSAPGVQKGILISEPEYENLRKMYTEIYKETQPDNINFSQSTAISKFVKIIRKYNPAISDLSSSTLYGKPMNFAVALSTGLDISDETIMSELTLRDWKNRKLISNEVVQQYFKNYKQLADRLLENKNNPKIKINQNGTVFYWLNEYFMPTVLDAAVL